MASTAAARIRTTVAWVLGIAACVTCCYLLDKLGSRLSVPLRIYHDPLITVGSGMDEHETDVTTTSFGRAAMFMSLAVGFGVGRLVQVSDWHSASRARERLTFRAWPQFLICWAVASVLIERSFRGVRTSGWTNLLYLALEVGAMIGIGRGMYLWHSKRAAELDERQ